MIEETLNLLYRSTDRPAQLTLAGGGSGVLTASAADATTTLTGVLTSVNSPSVVEIGEELMLVTGKTADAVPIFTMARGYAGTPLQAHTVGDPVVVTPSWSRYQTRRHLIRGIQGSLSTGLPAVKTAAITPTARQYFIPAPADCLLPLSLAYVQSDMNGATKRWEEVTEWEYRDGVDQSVSASGAIITVPPALVSGNLTGTQTVQTLYLTYQAPYTWSSGNKEPGVAPGGENETIAWRPYAIDLPPLYAAAFSLTNREITRIEVDKTSYFNAEINFRQGVDFKIGMSVWQQYYKRLEECQKLDRSRDPKHRPFRRMHRTSWASGF
jgi:hypothetical protein